MQWINAKITWQVFTAAVTELKVTHLFIRWHPSTLPCLKKGFDCHTITVCSRYDVLKIFNLFQWSYKTAHGPHVSLGTFKDHVCTGFSWVYFCPVFSQNWRATVAGNTSTGKKKKKKKGKRFLSFTHNTEFHTIFCFTFKRQLISDIFLFSTRVGLKKYYCSLNLELRDSGT